MSQFSDLKTNKSKCKVAGIGDMKRVKAPLCSLECVNLLTKTIKLLCMDFWNNRKLGRERNFLDQITKLQNLEIYEKCEICHFLGNK